MTKTWRPSHQEMRREHVRARDEVEDSRAARARREASKSRERGRPGHAQPPPPPPSRCVVVPARLFGLKAQRLLSLSEEERTLFDSYSREVQGSPDHLLNTGAEGTAGGSAISSGILRPGLAFRRLRHSGGSALSGKGGELDLCPSDKPSHLPERSQSLAQLALVQVRPFSCSLLLGHEP